MAKPLTDPLSLELMRKVAEYPRMIEQAAVAYEPHRVAYYAYDLASLFHAYWNRGKEEGARFIDPDHQQDSLNRLALARLVGLALRRTLCVMAVEPVSEM
jgi:arginyl-tRNA synthetase